jgi:hypothetical protein
LGFWGLCFFVLFLFRVCGSGFWGWGVWNDSSEFSVFDFQVSVSGIRNSEIWNRVSGSGFRVPGFGFRDPGFGCQVSSLGLWVPGAGFRVPGSWFRVLGFGYRVSRPGFEYRVSHPAVRSPSEGRFLILPILNLV